jgi:hypothetical protein
MRQHGLSETVIAVTEDGTAIVNNNIGLFGGVSVFITIGNATAVANQKGLA